MRKIFTVLFLFAGCLSAQVRVNQDSLLQRLAAAKEDTNMVNLCIAIGDNYEGSEPIAAQRYYRQAITVSHKINFSKGLIKGLTYYGNACHIRDDYDSMIFYIEKALVIARNTKDSLNIGIALLNIGIGYGFKSEFETAIRYCMEGLKIVDGRHYNTIEVQINDRLQVLYMQMTQYDKAITFGEKAVQQSRELKMDAFLAQSLSNLAMSYQSKRMPEKALPLLTEALTIAKNLGNIDMQGAILLNIADLSLQSGDYKTMKVYVEQSLLLNRQLGSLLGEATSLRALAIYYLHERDFSRAKELIEKSIAISKENSFKMEEASSLRVLANLSFAANDLEGGEEYHRESDDIITKLIADILSDKSAVLEKKYETEKKDIQLKLQTVQLQKKDMLNYILIAGAVILVVVIVLLFLNYRQKQKLQQQRISELETEKQLTATEAVLKGEEQERSRLAKDLHDGLGGMLSGIKYSFNTMKGNLIMTPENHQAFERSMDMLDGSIKEMRRVAHNMMPEALVKFGLDTALKDFCNDINQSGAIEVSYHSVDLADATIEQTTSITIYRIIQELISNSIRHAAAKKVVVQVTKTNEQLAVTVEDDGKGFDTAVLNQSKGIGWTNIQHRINFLQGTLDINSQPGKGTSVYIEFNA